MEQIGLNIDASVKVLLERLNDTLSETETFMSGALVAGVCILERRDLD